MTQRRKTEMAMPSEQRIDDYVACRGVRCPYCDSDGLEAGPISKDDNGYASAATRCCVCSRGWRDLYKLYDVDVEDDDDADA